MKKTACFVSAVCLALSLSATAFANPHNYRNESTPYTNTQFDGTVRGTGLGTNATGTGIGTTRNGMNNYGVNGNVTPVPGYTTTAQRTNNFRTTAAADNDMDWGWLGLIGLFGLAGLRNRNRERT